MRCPADPARSHEPREAPPGLSAVPAQAPLGPHQPDRSSNLARCHLSREGLGPCAAKRWKPDFLTWDLEPDAAVTWKEVLGTAFPFRDFLAQRGLQPLVKTSGGKGIHVLHLNPKLGWDVLKPFSKAVAEAIVAFNPQKLLSTASKAKRTGKIYIDWLRNGRGSTCISPWGLRARAGATISMPIAWEQLPEITSTGFTIHEPHEKPPEWLKLRPQAISMVVLREFGLG